MKLLITELDNILCDESGSLYDDSSAFVKSAHEKFFTIILTNHPLRNTQERVKNCGISEYIDLIVSATEYEMPKPDPRMINVLLALLNNEGKKFSKTDIVLVGDRPSIDVKFGNKAGIQTIRMRRGKFAGEEPEYPEETSKIEVKNLDELAASIGVEIKKEIIVEEKRRDDLSGSFGLEDAEPRQDDLSRGIVISSEKLLAHSTKRAPAKKKKRSQPRKRARKPAAKKEKTKSPRLGFFGI